jgi:DNA-binding NtrC family response regulator
MPPLRILSLEDDPNDTDLIREQLEAENIASRVTRVDTEAAFRAALEPGQVDIVLADYSLPSFDGISALKLAMKMLPDVPFIFVSGTLGEEVAIEALKIGATDYILKTKLARLAPSVLRALREAGERAERKQAGEELRRNQAYLAEAQKLSRTGSFGWNVAKGEVYWSEESFRIFECPRETKVRIATVIERTHPEDRSGLQELMQRVSREETEFDFEHRLLTPDGSVKYVRVMGCPSKDKAGNLEFVGAVSDITKSKLTQEALRRSEASLLEAQRLSHTGSWTYDVLAGRVTLSPELLRIFDLQADDTASTTSFFRDRIHPEDWPAVEACHDKALAAKVDFESNYRIVLPDGTIKYIHDVGHPKLSESGELLEYVGTTMDVTEQHEARRALETALDQIKALKDQLYEENIALREEIDRSSMFEEIVGESPALQAVLAHVVKVAPTDSTVLITGETGTGKELIARAIHKRSQRSAGVFVSVNCAAVPTSLIASELFGHEKGAFTGAIQRRLGRFELAEGGTIFLDEIGELPSDIQIALLRVLQEREFERVGSAKVLRADLRVIAATNRNLPAAIDAGTFRKDLYYRLNVFPIEMPPLRKRREDIPVLLEYFINRYASKAGKKIRGISKGTLERLTTYSWPGNIRELQNVIERSVVICESETFSIDENWLRSRLEENNEADRVVTLRMSASEEKEAIETALARSQGRISGPAGAAARLGIPPSTLDSKIKALRINKHRFKAV